MIDLRIFQNFLRVISLGSVSRAAEQVGLTQSALSQQIAALESEFNTVLLHRTSKGVRPTEAGLIVAGRLQVIVKQFDTAREEVNFKHELPTGVVSVGLPSSVAEILSVPLVEECRARYQGIHLRIGASPNRSLAEELLASRLDFAVMFEASPHKELKHFHVGAESFYMVCAASSNNAKKHEAALEDLAESNLILPCRPHFIRSTLEQRCAARNIKIKFAAEVDSLSNIVDLVASGQYESILPWSALARHVNQGVAVAVPFDPGISRTVNISALSEVPLSGAAALVLRLMVEVVQRLVTGQRWKGLRLVRDLNVDSVCDQFSSARFSLIRP
ncbi:LysR family transcriptional regulator [Paraburkholderia silviterrae]|uniref:LysR family transcriptional regulator n=1 Tax=Paraburkholderia silviterrae TaxID=2528715 RepID=A0A4R5M9D7_9BURK|nr:LysR family transcriptional regulator [Paraburkholderia silviterrae]TDG22783.1 LysR family transcriptional regulator [Paraburkholderia silviterrae]